MSTILTGGQTKKIVLIQKSNPTHGSAAIMLVEDHCFGEDKAIAGAILISKQTQKMASPLTGLFAIKTLHHGMIMPNVLQASVGQWKAWLNYPTDNSFPQWN